MIERSHCALINLDEEYVVMINREAVNLWERRKELIFLKH